MCWKNQSFDACDLGDFVRFFQQAINRYSFSLKCGKELLCHPFPGIGKSEIGDVGSELNNLMLAHLRLGVIIMDPCMDSLGIILEFFHEFFPYFCLDSYNQNRVHEGLLLTEKHLSRGVTMLGMVFGVENVPKALSLAVALKAS